MIRVRDLFRLQGVIGLRLCAGQTGLHHRVHAAVLLEYQEERLLLSDYYRGDLVLSTLDFARNDAGLVRRSLMALIRQGVVGIMIKTGHYRELPEDVIAEANRTGTPVFLFDESYIEEVLLEITELIRGREHFSGYEKDIDALMQGSLTGDQIRMRVRRIDPDGIGPALIYAIDAGKQTRLLEDALFEMAGEEQSDYVIMSWRHLLLVLIHPREEDETDFVPLDALLHRVGRDPDTMIAGCCSLCLTPDHAGIAFSEAVYAVRTAKARGLKRMRAADMGLYGYLLPMAFDPFAKTRCRELINRLHEYDWRNGANLEQTARTYIHMSHGIAETARVLYQHPNTVRYRLGKIRQLFGVEQESTFETLLEITVTLSEILGLEDDNA